jgi:hypothetical protein
MITAEFFSQETYQDTAYAEIAVINPCLSCNVIWQIFTSGQQSTRRERRQVVAPKGLA